MVRNRRRMAFLCIVLFALLGVAAVYAEQPEREWKLEKSSVQDTRAGIWTIATDGVDTVILVTYDGWMPVYDGNGNFQYSLRFRGKIRNVSHVRGDTFRAVCGSTACYFNLSDLLLREYEIKPFEEQEFLKTREEARLENGNLFILRMVPVLRAQVKMIYAKSGQIRIVYQQGWGRTTVFFLILSLNIAAAIYLKRRKRQKLQRR